MPKYKIEPMFGPGFMIVNTDLDDIAVVDIPSLEEAEKKLDELNAAAAADEAEKQIKQ